MAAASAATSGTAIRCRSCCHWPCCLPLQLPMKCNSCKHLLAEWDGSLLCYWYRKLPHTLQSAFKSCNVNHNILPCTANENANPEGTRPMQTFAQPGRAQSAMSFQSMLQRQILRATCCQPAPARCKCCLKRLWPWCMKAPPHCNRIHSRLLYQK
jgi:hypothetical protein